MRNHPQIQVRLGAASTPNCPALQRLFTWVSRKKGCGSNLETKTSPGFVFGAFKLHSSCTCRLEFVKFSPKVRGMLKVNTLSLCNQVWSGLVKEASTGHFLSHPLAWCKTQDRQSKTKKHWKQWMCKALLSYQLNQQWLGAMTAQCQLIPPTSVCGRPGRAGGTNQSSWMTAPHLCVTLRRTQLQSVWSLIHQYAHMVCLSGAGKKRNSTSERPSRKVLVTMDGKSQSFKEGKTHTFLVDPFEFESNSSGFMSLHTPWIWQSLLNSCSVFSS